MILVKIYIIQLSPINIDLKGSKPIQVSEHPGQQISAYLAKKVIMLYLAGNLFFFLSFFFSFFLLVCPNSEKIF